MFQLNRGEFAFKQLHFEMDLRAIRTQTQAHGEPNLYECEYIVGWLAINIF